MIDNILNDHVTALLRSIILKRGCVDIEEMKLTCMCIYRRDDVGKGYEIYVWYHNSIHMEHGPHVPSSWVIHVRAPGSILDGVIRAGQKRDAGRSMYICEGV
jgi:hypothetical protein